MEEELNPEKDVEAWRAEYELLSKNPPAEGDFLYADENCSEGKKTKLIIECTMGKFPFIYARVFIPNEVGAKLGWYTQPEGSTSNYGLKCILMPKARNEVISRFGMTSREVYVKSLRVINRSETGKSLLVEVSEW